jgi:hypothetical protein
MKRRRWKAKKRRWKAKKRRWKAKEEEMESGTGFDSSTSKWRHLTCIERNSVL